MKELSEIPAVNQTMNSPTMSIMNKDLSVKNRFKIKRLNKEERRDKFIEENQFYELGFLLEAWVLF